MKIIKNGVCGFDEYDTMGYTFDLEKPLSSFQTDLIHRTFPGVEILNAEYTRDEWLPCPIRLILRMKDDLPKTVYLRITRLKNGISNEAYVLRLLYRMGLNVPYVYTSPVIDPNFPQLGDMILISEIQGKNLYECYDLETSEGTVNAKKSILKCVDTLYSYTDRMKDAGADKILPVVSLTDELAMIKKRGGAWFSHPQFYRTYQYLEKILPDIHQELVFSNGDINPCNFLCTGGDSPSFGFIDFSHSCFNDPLYGFAKYITYDMNPFDRNGLIEDYLASIGKTWGDFHPRLLLRALWTLQREITLGQDDKYSRMLLRILG